MIQKWSLNVIVNLSPANELGLRRIRFDDVNYWRVKTIPRTYAAKNRVEGGGVKRDGFSTSDRHQARHPASIRTRSYINAQVRPRVVRAYQSAKAPLTRGFMVISTRYTDVTRSSHPRSSVTQTEVRYKKHARYRQSKRIFKEV